MVQRTDYDYALGKNVGTCQEVSPKMCFAVVCSVYLTVILLYKTRKIPCRILFFSVPFLSGQPFILCGIWTFMELSPDMRSVHSFITPAFAHLLSNKHNGVFYTVSKLILVLLPAQARAMYCSQFLVYCVSCSDCSVTFITPDFLSLSSILACPWHFLFFYMSGHLFY